MKVQLVAIVYFLVVLQVTSGHNYVNILFCFHTSEKCPPHCIMEMVFTH